MTRRRLTEKDPSPQPSPCDLGRGTVVKACRGERGPERKTAWHVLPFVLLVLLTLAACDNQDEAEEVEFRVPVTVRGVEQGTVEDLIVATGTLRAAENVVLRSETAGFLTLAQGARGRLAEGDHVKAGQVIADITGEDVRLASAKVSREKRYESAQRVLKSRQELYEFGLIPEEELRNAETTLADAELERDRGRLTSERTQIKTPIDGVVIRLVREAGSDLPLADGQRIDAGFTIAQIAPTDTLIADVDLVGLDLARVEENLAARLRHYAWEDERFAGTLIRLAPSIDPVTRTVRAEVAVPNQDGRLRPGMFVEVTLVAERREDVIVVPRESVTERGGKRVVFVLNGQRVAEKEVVLGLGDDEVVEVRQGVDLEDRIVVRGLETLTKDTRVRVTG